MKLQFLVLSFLVLYLLTVEACNRDADREICVAINKRCRETEAVRPTINPEDVLIPFNKECSERVGADWRDVVRCDLVRAICELTIVRCQKVTCRNVQAVIES
uniref:Uncharacterized protein n=1 Tax=Ceratitis capitata TaxID=7213 RepID=W8CBI3_CERCA